MFNNIFCDSTPQDYEVTNSLHHDSYEKLAEIVKNIDWSDEIRSHKDVKRAMLSVDYERFKLLCNVFGDREVTAEIHRNYGNFILHMEGTLLSCAAALGRIDLMQHLISIGYDLQGRNADNSFYFYSEKDDLNMIHPFRRWLGDRGQLCDGSPLTCGILCGQPDAVRLLMQYPDQLQSIDDHDISCAVIYALQGNEMQKAAAEAAFPGITSKENWKSFHLHPWAVANHFPLDLLNEYLDRCPYSPEDWKEFLGYCSEHCTDNRFRPSDRHIDPLKLVLRYYKKTDRNFILGWLLQQTGLQDNNSIRTWLKLAGKSFDMSSYMDVIRMSKSSDFRQFAKQAHENGIELFMDMDAVLPTTSYSELYTMMKYFKLERRNPNGDSISGFTRAVIQNSNLRLLKSVIKSGLIESEPIPVMLQFLKESSWGQILRPYIMLMEQSPEKKKPWTEPCYATYRYHDNQSLEPFGYMDNFKKLMVRLVNSSFTEKEIIAELINHNMTNKSNQFGYQEQFYLSSGFETIFHVLAAGRNLIAVRTILKYMPSIMENHEDTGDLYAYNYNIGCSGLFDLFTFAALYDNVPLMDMILSLHPAQDINKRMRFTMNGTISSHMITPFWTAIFYEKENAARFLKNHGADTDCNSMMAKALQKHLSANSKIILKKILQE